MDNVLYAGFNTDHKIPICTLPMTTVAPTSMVTVGLGSETSTAKIPVVIEESMVRSTVPKEVELADVVQEPSLERRAGRFQVRHDFF